MAPCFERTEMSSDEGVTRQRALVGNSLNDEQRSDGLSDPSHQTTCPETGSQESTNLSRREDGYEEIRNGIVVDGQRCKN